LTQNCAGGLHQGGGFFEGIFIAQIQTFWEEIKQPAVYMSLLIVLATRQTRASKA
jgi:hypothetical protein